MIIVDDPALGIREDNLIPKPDGKCPHLLGDAPGSYSCAVHNMPWYKETPCFRHGQIERDPNSECRFGAYLLKRGKSDG